MNVAVRGSNGACRNTIAASASAGSATTSPYAAAAAAGNPST